ncbi:hypothetical protein J5X84_16705 [Streptosporangiaceae bacterium NEAU-GS5]|nr:hypothetical protein [Streptosporangiaceae bacterium NEAU-GS5]
MIRRLFWMSVGAYLAVFVMRRLQALKPDHVARRAVDEVRLFAEDVKSIAARRETELRAQFGAGDAREIHTTAYDVKDGR